MRTSNPILKESTFDSFTYLTGEERAQGMTIKGTSLKALLLIVLALITASIT